MIARDIGMKRRRISASRRNGEYCPKLAWAGSNDTCEIQRENRIQENLLNQSMPNNFSRNCSLDQRKF